MPKWIPHKCKRCGVERTATQHVSRRGLCPSCAIANVTEAVRKSQDRGRAGGIKSGEVRRGEIPSKRAKRVGGTPTPPGRQLTPEPAGQRTSSQ